MPQDADTTAAGRARGIPCIQLDAYPRLCGLPVTFERLVPVARVPPEPTGPPAPASSARRP